jgi:hypothetical protein
MRQLESFEMTRSAPVSRIDAHLTSPIAVEISGNFTENVPPNPQHVSASFISMSSNPRTCFKSSRGSRLIPISRSPWHPSWNVAFAG